MVFVVSIRHNCEHLWCASIQFSFVLHHHAAGLCQERKTAIGIRGSAGPVKNANVTVDFKQLRFTLHGVTPNAHRAKDTRGTEATC